MFVVDLASALLNAIVRLALVLATALLWPLVFIYPIILGLLLLDVPQRAILFLHHVNFPFWTDFSKPEVFGFSPSKVRNLTLRTSDGVKIGAWHILPSGYYRKVNSELEKKAIAAGASPRDLRKKGSMIGLQEQLQALKERPVFLYFHGNAGNRAAPRRIDTYRGISERLNANVLAIDYRGFGDSQGTPTEDGLAKDARAAWDYLTIECGVAADQIILIGHSLGTGVAARLARDLSTDAKAAKPRGVLLQSPYASIPDVAFEFRMFQVVPILQPVMMIPALHELLRAKILDRFDSLSHIAHISCPVLMIHGLGDREIPSLHSRMLFTAAASAHGVAETPAPERAHIVHTVRRAATAPAAARAAAAAVVASKGPVETAGVRDGVAKAQMGVVEDAATLQLAKLFAACEEDAGDRWALEGKRWISTQGAARGDGAQPAGPAKVMLVELIHAHHNNVQSHDLTYESIETFFDISVDN